MDGIRKDTQLLSKAGKSETEITIDVIVNIGRNEGYPPGVWNVVMTIELEVVQVLEREA